MIEGLHHFDIIVSSEASVQFYERLGFSEFYRKQRDYDTVVLMNGYGIEIELFIDPTHPERDTNPERLGLRNISFKVDNIEKTFAELGVQIDKIGMDWIGRKYAFIVDPDGNPVQLHE